MARSTIAGLAVQPSPPSMLKSMKLGFLEKDERGATHRPRMKQQQQQQSDTPKPKIKSISEKLAKVDDADDDAILDAAIALNNSCWFTKCKEKVSLLGVTCPHCTYRYCMQHSMPEASSHLDFLISACFVDFPFAFLTHFFGPRFTAAGMRPGPRREAKRKHAARTLLQACCSASPKASSPASETSFRRSSRNPSARRRKRGQQRQARKSSLAACGCFRHLLGDLRTCESKTSTALVSSRQIDLYVRARMCTLCRCRERPCRQTEREACRPAASRRMLPRASAPIQRNLRWTCGWRRLREP
eukprot:m.636532 g.636532  ORF g.636532 m.636532 type:complete len:301 (+) comp58311_c0_seq2:3790-4692(+)